MLMPFEWVVGDSSKDHTVTAPTSKTRPAATVRYTTLRGTTDADGVIDSEAFGVLTAELRRAEASGYDIDRLLPPLVAARNFADAHDIAAVLHSRVTRATAQFGERARIRRDERLIAGIVPIASGEMADDMRLALFERQRLIEERALALVEDAVEHSAPWLRGLGGVPGDAEWAKAWRQEARVVAAYRDRHGVTGDDPVGTAGVTDGQRMDAALARQAASRARMLAAGPATWDSDRRLPAPRRGLAL